MILSATDRADNGVSSNVKLPISQRSCRFIIVNVISKVDSGSVFNVLLLGGWCCHGC